MDPERLQRIRELFARLLELPPGERDEAAAALAGHDEELRAELGSLLASHVPTSGGDGPPEWSATRLSAVFGDLSGTSAGPYLLRRRIGQGGMGDVYLAERSDGQFTREVAVKVIKAGMDTAVLLRRFQHEREILAGLNHPGIAGLLDAGVTADGRPYLVMEYVDGQPITAWCRQAGADPGARVRLFQEVCAAVDHAHRHLVVHRDLKPANILVTPAGRVKLLDFGIAKLLQPSRDTPDLTTEGGRALTPAYASPEQVRGEPVTTASDVFSLGVILYELLAGRRPLALEDTSVAQAIERVTTEEPARPSVIAASEPGHQSWTRHLAGDLDTIVLKALRKEPDRRYASAAALSDDLRRFLEGHRVLARPDTLGYRVRKFVRRHRIAVPVSVTGALLLATALAAAMLQAQRAAEERGRALQRMASVRELANSLLFEVHDAIANLPGATEARRLILERGLAKLDDLAAQVRGTPDLEWELAEAYLRTGIVQGDPTRASLGDLDGALASFERAIALAAQLVADHPRDLRARRTLALAHEKLGDARAWHGEVAEGVEHARQALELYRSIAAVHPDSTRHALSVVISLVKLGDLSGNPNFPNLERSEESVGHYAEARALLDAPPLRDGPDWGTRRYAALVDERIGSLERARARFAEAGRAFERSLAAREQLAREQPANLDARRDLGVTRQNLCEVHLALDQAAQALPLCREAHAIYTELHRADPENAQGVSDVAIGSFSLAGARRATGDLTGALDVLAEGVTVIRAALALESGNVPNRRTLARLLGRHTLFAREAGLPAPWAAEARAVLAALRADGQARPEDEALDAELARRP